MLNHKLLKDNGILIIQPDGPLLSSDFAAITGEVDPYIEAKGKLHGLMICTETFPGWDNFAALISHLKFIKSHHQKIEKVAAVTDSSFLRIMPHIAEHFINAEVKHFDFDQQDAAREWLAERQADAPE